jgi:phosphoserine phosphatase
LATALAGEGAVRFCDRVEGPPGLAAFDADGTLWQGDVGEELLRELIRRGALIDPPPDPWGEYVRRVRRDPADGFAFAARVMHGLEEGAVREVSAEVFAERCAKGTFHSVSFWLERLMALGWEVYIVSASYRWSVEVGVAQFGVSPQRVIALELEVENGVLSDRVLLPVPTLEGKVALLREAAGRDADIAFGNSVLDLPLLLASAHPVAVGLPYPGNRFLAQARKRGFAILEIPLGQ